MPALVRTNMGRNVALIAHFIECFRNKSTWASAQRTIGAVHTTIIHLRTIVLRAFPLRLVGATNAALLSPARIEGFGGSDHGIIVSYISAIVLIG